MRTLVMTQHSNEAQIRIHQESIAMYNEVLENYKLQMERIHKDITDLQTLIEDIKADETRN